MVVRNIAAGVVAFGLIAPAAYAGQNHPRGINAREHRQAQRIRAGVKNGEITKGELDKLRADEAGVRAEERVYRKSGGGLNNAERKDLEKDLNQTSREIYRAKHNDRKPPAPPQQ
jgi:hypothetical protein